MFISVSVVRKKPRIQCHMLYIAPGHVTMLWGGCFRVSVQPAPTNRAPPVELLLTHHQLPTPLGGQQSVMVSAPLDCQITPPQGEPCVHSNLDQPLTPRHTPLMWPCGISRVPPATYQALCGFIKSF